MTQRILTLFTALTLALVGCASAQSITDMTGREIVLDAPAQRVIALNPADCEILYAIGAQEVLVGRGEYCNYPEEALDLPSVNSGAETNVEQILALEPDVIVMSKMAQTVEQVEALEAAGVRVVVSDAQSIEGTYDAIALIGALVGREDEASMLIAQMQDGFAALSEQSEEVGKTVYFEVSPLEWGLWTAGADTFLDELAQVCGLQNAFADVSGWAEISQEQVLARDPDYIVTTSVDLGQGLSPEAEIMARTGWESLKAVENANVFSIGADESSRPGPRLLEAAEALWRLVYADEAQQPAAD